MNADRKKIIDRFLDFIEYMVRRNSSRITKIVVQNLITKDKALNNDAEYSDDDASNEFLDEEKNRKVLQDEKSIFFDIILENLEKQIQQFNNVQIYKSEQQKIYDDLPFLKLMVQMSVEKQLGQGGSLTLSQNRN